MPGRSSPRSPKLGPFIRDILVQGMASPSDLHKAWDRKLREEPTVRGKRRRSPAYHSFLNYFHLFKLLGLVAPVVDERGRISEPSRRPVLHPKLFYMLTAQGQAASDFEWVNPNDRLYPHLPEQRAAWRAGRVPVEITPLLPMVAPTVPVVLPLPRPPRGRGVPRETIEADILTLAGRAESLRGAPPTAEATIADLREELRTLRNRAMAGEHDDLEERLDASLGSLDVVTMALARVRGETMPRRLADAKDAYAESLARVLALLAS